MRKFWKILIALYVGLLFALSAISLSFALTPEEQACWQEATDFLLEHAPKYRRGAKLPVDPDQIPDYVDCSRAKLWKARKCGLPVKNATADGMIQGEEDNLAGWTGKYVGFEKALPADLIGMQMKVDKDKLKTAAAKAFREGEPYDHIGDFVTPTIGGYMATMAHAGSNGYCRVFVEKDDANYWWPRIKRIKRLEFK